MENPTCSKCGAVLVPAKEPIKMNGALPTDGTWSFGNMVCPNCHPELAQK